MIPGLVEAGYRVVAPDLRGIGATSKAAAGYDVRNLAEDAAALLVSLNAPQAVVVGFDLGVQTAFMLAMRHPELISKLVLTEALIGRLPGAEEFFKAGPPWWFGFHAAARLAEDAIARNEAVYLNWFYEHSTVQKLAYFSFASSRRRYCGFFQTLQQKEYGWRYLQHLFFFDFYGAAGWAEGGPISHNMSVTSVWIVAPLAAVLGIILLNREIPRNEGNV